MWLKSQVDSARPLLVFVPGFLRSERDHPAFLTVLRQHFRVVVWHLPGHLRPRPADVGMRAIVAELRGFVAGLAVDAVLVGESLGGLAAMLLAVDRAPRNLRGVLAFDPPLQMSKLWPIHQELRKRATNRALLEDYAGPVFGCLPDGVVVERDFRPLLTVLPAVKVLIVAGGIELHPERATEAPPSLLDAGDRRLIASAEGFHLKVASADAGHDIIGDDPDGSVRTILDYTRSTITRPGAPEICALEPADPPPPGAPA